jgi:hypothetical protein
VEVDDILSRFNKPLFPSGKHFRRRDLLRGADLGGVAAVILVNGDKKVLRLRLSVR